MSVARFKVEFYDKTAEKEYLSLDGKPLSGLLAGCRALQFRTDGIRVRYRIRDGHVEVVQIIAIGARDKVKVFDLTSRRLDSDD